MQSSISTCPQNTRNSLDDLTRVKIKTMAKKEQIQWDTAISKAQEAIQELLEMQSDYQAKYDELTEEQLEGEKGFALSEICDLDLQSIADTLSDASEIKLP